MLIFYDFLKQITYVGADDGQMLGSGFVNLNPVNILLYPLQCLRQFLVCTIGVITEPSMEYSSISCWPASLLTPANVTFLKVTYLETLSRCLMKYKASIKLLSDIVLNLSPGSGAPVAVTPLGRRRTLQRVLTDSYYRYLNYSIEFIAWLLYIDDDAASATKMHFRIALQASHSVLVAIDDLSRGYIVQISLRYVLTYYCPFDIQYHYRYYQSTNIYFAYEIER